MTDHKGPLRIGVAGLGTVGGGVLRLLAANAGLIEARAGRPVQVVAVSARDPARDRGINLSGLRWHADPAALAADTAVDVVVELIGGANGPAHALVSAALLAGKPVVTANKALIAHHGATLASIAAQTGAPLLFEAAVAGGIPVLKVLREGLAANHIQRVAGILNGTCNYILTTMRDERREFADVLADAQRLGYAEADPAFDIDGVDTAHKLAILAALAFNGPVDFASVYVEGIRAVSAQDIGYADELGYRIKLLGLASQSPAGVSLRVHPCLVPLSNPIALVDGVQNAVVIEGDAVGRVVLEGRGAGAGPTASAVVADLIDIARGRTGPAWGLDPAGMVPGATVPMLAHHGAYYLRLLVQDRAGVIADVTAALRDAGVSLESMLQRGRGPAGDAVTVVLVTHETGESAIRQALASIAALPSVVAPPALIRIEPS